MIKQEALLELSMINAETIDYDFTDAKVKFINFGIPPEIVTRFEVLWEHTKVIGGEAVAVGKIIVMQIYDFILANINIATGIALGAILAAIVSSVPFLGVLIGPLLSSCAIFYGAFKGAKLDAQTNDPVKAIFKTAQSFILLFRNIFIALKEYWEAKGNA